MDVFILINAEPGKVFEVANAVAKIESVGVARAVAGQYDVIAYLTLDDMSRLASIIERVQKIQGVRRTQTSVSLYRE